MLQIRPIEQHPSKQTFKKHGIRISQVAQAMELSFPYVCQMLNGDVRCSPKNDKKLKELADSLNNKKKK